LVYLLRRSGARLVPVEVIPTKLAQLDKY